MTTTRDRVRRIALVRLDRIGDFLLWMSTARFYRSHFRAAEIVFFGNEAIADLARAMPYWDRFVAVRVPENNQPYLVNSSPGGRFDVVINPQYSRTLAYDRFIAGLPADRRVAVGVRGPNMTQAEHFESNALYSELVTLSHEPMHESLRNFEILTAITGTTQPAVLESLTPFLEPVRHRLPDPYVAIFPVSSWHKKSYPWPRIVAACRLMKERFGVTAVLCGSADDKVVAANIQRNAGDAVVDLTGVLDLRQSLTLIAGAQLVIANDSMAAHAANYLRRPSVCFVGGGYNDAGGPGERSSGRFFPYPEDLVSADMQVILEHVMSCWGCSYICKYSSVARDCIPCLDYISLKSLLAAADKGLTAAGLERRGRVAAATDVCQENFALH